MSKKRPTKRTPKPVVAKEAAEIPELNFNIEEDRAVSETVPDKARFWKMRLVYATERANKTGKDMSEYGNAAFSEWDKCR